MANKYEPIRRCLEGHAEEEVVSLTWAELEELVGPLPASSSVRQWWANTAASPPGSELAGSGEAGD